MSVSSAWPHRFASSRALYVHIPFCHSKCAYCDFFSVPVRGDEPSRYVDLLLSEIEKPHFLIPQPVTSIYYGGGTPSLLPLPELDRLHAALVERFTPTSDAEVTLECNPEDVTPATLLALHGLGVNRLSLGVQSLDDSVLRFLGRNHPPDAALTALQAIANGPIENFTVDLIYGIPGQSLASLDGTVSTLLSFRPWHISAYHLMLEPGTPLHVRWVRKRFSALSDDASAAHFDLVRARLLEAGYEHYEVSNYARGARYALHNSAYWFGASYLGLGASAHSFTPGFRWANPCTIKEYAQSLSGDGGSHLFHESITPSMALDELLLTRLRTQWGLSIDEVEGEFGSAVRDRLLAGAEPYVQQGQMIEEDGRLALAADSFLRSDGIILSLARALSE